MMGCTKRPTKPLLAWRFFLRPFLRFVADNTSERRAQPLWREAHAARATSSKGKRDAKT